MEFPHTQFPIAAVNARPGRARHGFTRASVGCAGPLVTRAPRQSGCDDAPAPSTGVLASLRASGIFAVIAAGKPVPRP